LGAVRTYRPHDRLQNPLPATPLRAAGPAGSALDEARERAIRLLTDGFAYDVITVEEFERRLGRLGQADTPRAVDALVADLGAPARTGLAPHQASTTVPAEGRILGLLSATRREGPWRVPQHLDVIAVMSEVRIDLRYAVLPPACTIDVSAVMANVHFIVQPGMVVEFDVGSFMATTRNDVRAQRLDGYLQPHVRIHGFAIMAEVRVRVRDLSW
jgi:hypothetical protein